ncbi:PAS domain S-box protein [Propionivibrio sp.]|uniref:PAS domain S-box protein n=1 Tax=Propionivibrio sp. TaxID=2212460 RepID=UPI003BF35FF6
MRPHDPRLRATVASQFTDAPPAKTLERSVESLQHDLQVNQIELEMQNEALREAKIALEESRDRFVDLYEFAPVGYLTLTADGRIAEINLAGRMLLGVVLKKLLNRHFTIFVTDEDQDNWHRHFMSLKRDGTQVKVELALRRGDGSVFHAQLNCTRTAGSTLKASSRHGLRPAEENLLAPGSHEIRLTLTDISERKQIEDRLILNEAKTRSILEGAADAIFIVDQQGRYQYANQKASQLFGYSYDEMLGMSIADITPAEDMQVALSLFEKLLTTGSLRCELLLKCRDGGTIAVDFSGSLLPDGTVFGSCRDITASKLAEEQRDQQRDTLVREVHHRIKNNLQGVAGLLHRELGKFLELDPRLKAAISQIDTIAVVHGLQSSNSGEAIRLCDSLRNICKMVSELSQRPVLFHIEHEQSTFRPVQIESNEAVSIALVLNELILNAVKHSPAGSADPAVSLLSNGTIAQIVIRNAASGTPAFDIDTGQGLGTGLRLVRSLLPNEGAHLSYGLDNRDFVHTTLILKSPVLISSFQKERSLS